ncbi:MAG: hypothetical protein EOP49_29460 [Sphingobacteriales bacterium]|nr:MAG: hypothetical protein EOP49_29460 [Sphingobacteriales bacterium]
MISRQEYLFNEAEFNFWSFIRIEPRRWLEPTMADDIGGFWSVAVFGNKVLYYNEYEEGFNVSRYTSYGTIAEYHSNQNDLYDTVTVIYSGLAHEPYWTY